MAWQLITAKTVKITERLATEFMTMDPAPHDRNLSERRTQVYERLIRNGQWRPCVWAKAICTETGSTYRVNGKHTSTLFSTLAREFPEHVVTVESYECDTLEDVGRLYGTFDSSINSRTATDINRAFAATIPELSSIRQKIIDVCTSGIALHECGGKHVATFKSACERAEYLLEYPEFVIWLNDLISDKDKHLCRQGVVAAIFGSYLKAKGKAEEFWTAVRDEVGERPTCPDRVLSRWLLVTSVKAPNVSITTRKADTREFYVRCIHCWNAWRRHEDLRIIKYTPSAKVPAFN